MPLRRRCQAGFTLMELTVVVGLAGVVTLGLVAFYLNSQMLWMDASTQALAQRDATTIIESMREEAETASSADVQSSGGVNNMVIFYRGQAQQGGFFWRPADSLVHYLSPGGADRGPIVPTKVEKFYVSLDPDSMPLLRVDTLRVRSTTGQRVQLSSGLALYNAP